MVRQNLVPLLYTTIRKMYNAKTVSEQLGRVIDLRSDTVTKPSTLMRDAMRNAIVGDDVYKEDPTVNELEKRCATMFGMEASLFVPTGTMGNLVSIMAHCYQRRDCEIIVGNKQHIFKYEQGGYAQVYELAQSAGVKVHLDGARLMNAAVASDLNVSDILKYTDSVSMCFSKNLGAPVGSIVAGTKEFISRVLRHRKVLGGGWRQAGVLAAACLVGLDNCQNQISLDHTNAKSLANGLNSLHSSLIKVDMNTVETNIIMVDTDSSLEAEKLSLLLGKAYAPEDVSVLCLPMDKYKLRLVTHCDFNADDINSVINKFDNVLRQLS